MLISVLDDAAMQRVCSDRKQDCLFASANWVNLIRESFGFRMLSTSNYNDLSICFAEIDDIVGKRLVCLPFTDYTHMGKTASVEMHLASLGRAFPESCIRLRVAGSHVEVPGPDWSSERLSIYHRVRTDQPVDRVWSGLASSFRRGVRKAEKDGVSVEIVRSREGMRQFYGLYWRHRKDRFRVLSQPWSFFEALFDRFVNKSLGYVVNAQRGGRTIASAVVLKHGSRHYYKYGASDQNQLQHRPNNKLFWELLRQGVEEGVDEVDLGMSWVDGRDQGIIRFKESMGGRAYPILTIERLPRGGDSEGRLLLRKLTELLVDIPLDDASASRAGNLLFRYFT